MRKNTGEPDVAQLKLRAKSGDAEAMLALSCLYLDGSGVKRSRRRARAWCVRAAEQGCERAYFRAGVLCRSAGEESRAFYWFGQAVRAGSDCEAFAELARYYLQGEQTVRDEAYALELLAHGAQRGSPGAALWLAECRFFGIGAPADFTECVRILRTPLLENHAGAQYRLGECCELGCGVQADCDEAARLYQAAADQGHTLAKARLQALRHVDRRERNHRAKEP